ncbi:MAG: PDZ domain-containing protein [Clostridia bacterium]|nr:PDZ domain-containing protein [Clostridia bacterium]
MKRIIGLAIAFCILLTNVYALEVNTSQQAQVFFEAVEANIKQNVRYEDLTSEEMYKGAILKVLEENPQMYKTVLSGMLESIDEYSNYFDVAQSETFFTTLEDTTLVGIGIQFVMMNGCATVEMVLENSPAEKCGVKPGDIIRFVDGKDITGMDIEAVSSLIKGVKGTTVTLKVSRSGFSNFIEIPIVRDVVSTSSVSYEIMENEKGVKVGYVRISQFTDTSAQKTAEVLEKVEKETKNIIIDLRGNTGGYLDQAIAMSEIFLRGGKLIVSEDYKGKEFDINYYATGEGKDYKPVILVNKSSASASEVFTAALKENNMTKAVVGEKTYGKGTVQSAFQLLDGGTIKYTVAFYLTPKGNNLEKNGIKPDVEVFNHYEKFTDRYTEDFSYSRKYKLGDVGRDVRLAKKYLEYLGIFYGEINEIYDENLKNAVYMFQKSAGLYPYGEFDVTTQLELLKVLLDTEELVDVQLETALELF